MIKKLLVLALVLALTVSAVGCGKAKPKKSEELATEQLTAEKDIEDSDEEIKEDEEVWVAPLYQKYEAVKAFIKYFEDQGTADKLRINDVKPILTAEDGKPIRTFLIEYGYADDLGDWYSHDSMGLVIINDKEEYSVTYYANFEELQVELGEAIDIPLYQGYQPVDKEYNINSKEDRLVLAKEMKNPMDIDITTKYYYLSRNDRMDMFVEILMYAIYNGDTEEISKIVEMYTSSKEDYNNVMEDIAVLDVGGVQLELTSVSGLDYIQIADKITVKDVEFTCGMFADFTVDGEFNRDYLKITMELTEDNMLAHNIKGLSWDN